MTTEHQTAPDFPERREPDDAGSEDSSEDGPLDPSVFFGLFDDLDNGPAAKDDPSDEAEQSEQGDVSGTPDTAEEPAAPDGESEVPPAPEEVPSSNGRSPLPNLDDQAGEMDLDDAIGLVLGTPEDEGRQTESGESEGGAVVRPDNDGLITGHASEHGRTDDSVDSASPIEPRGETTVETTVESGGPNMRPTPPPPPLPTEPQSIEPQSVESQSIEPQSVESQSIEPQSIEPQSVDSTYGTYQPPPPLAEPATNSFADSFTSNPQDSAPVLLGGLDEVPLDRSPADQLHADHFQAAHLRDDHGVRLGSESGSSSSDQFGSAYSYSPQADTYRLEEQQTSHQFHEQHVGQHGGQQSGRQDGQHLGQQGGHPLEQRQSAPKGRDQDSSLTVTAVVMTIAASFAVGLIGLAAMFALTDGDNETVAEAGSEETADSTAAAEEGGDQEQQAATSSETQPDATTAEAAASTTADTIDVAGGTETAPDGEVNPLLDPVGAMASAAENGRLDLMSLEFVPGTETLTPQSVSLVEALGPRLAELATPITISVRANGAATAQGNLDLSDQQATALVAALVAAGVPETQIRTVGLGAGPLSASLPVPDFVAATPELGDAAFSNSVAASGPFTIGSSLSDPDTFRVEGVTDAVRLRQAMDRFTDSTIGLAAYSFFAPDNQSARAAAGRLADSVVAELTSGAVTADRITVITPGAAPYVVTPELGGHVWLQTGSESSMAFEVAGIDSTTITFEPNTASLTADGQAALDQLAVAVNAGVGSLTIDVRTYSEPTPEANTTLSQQQAAEIGRFLSEIGGVDAGRLRSFGSGPTTYYPDNGGSTVTLIVGPAN